MSGWARQVEACQPAATQRGARLLPPPGHLLHLLSRPADLGRLPCVTGPRHHGLDGLAQQQPSQRKRKIVQRSAPRLQTCWVMAAPAQPDWALSVRQDPLPTLSSEDDEHSRSLSLAIQTPPLLPCISGDQILRPSNRFELCLHLQQKAELK